MGGAAGRRARLAMCAEAFAELDLIEHQGEEALRATIGVANRRIYERVADRRRGVGHGHDRDRGARRRGTAPSRSRTSATAARTSCATARSSACPRTTRSCTSWCAAGQLSEEEAEQPSPAQRDHARARRRARTCRSTPSRSTARPGDVAAAVHRRAEHDGLRAATSPTLLASPTTAADIARQLVRAALEGGGEDNVTAVVVRFGELATAGRRGGDHVRRDRHRVLPADIDEEPPAARRPQRPRSRSGLRRALIAASAVVLVFVLAVARRDRPAREPLHRRRHVDRQGRDLPGRAGGPAVRASSSTTSSTRRSVSYASLDRRPRRSLFDHRCAPNRARTEILRRTRWPAREVGPHPRALEPAAGSGCSPRSASWRSTRPGSRRSRAPR